ncbi:ubiquinone/menaquinone biosynthesis methyltransferase [Haloferula sp.]|uniref:ubiquinone/menaquinone biosynthesis methyltransferase n=1 Tax=Haloferula sp. TaxID=2497595 RepID=UPI003C7562A0
MKTEKFSLRAHEYLGSSEGKKLFNEKHFAESAPRYDLATRLLSLGQDRGWKRKLVASLPDVLEPVCVDVACGTGDVTFFLAERFGKGEFIGVDLTREMIDLANERNRSSGVRFYCGEMSRLPMDDGSVDILTGSYAIRNAPNLAEALAEFRRVLKPGGVLALLDFSKPKLAFFQGVQFQLLRFWGGLWGLVLHGNPEVHGYISKSLRSFPDAERLESTFADCGFEVIEARKHFGGMMMQYLLGG